MPFFHSIVWIPKCLLKTLLRCLICSLVLCQDCLRKIIILEYLLLSLLQPSVYLFRVSIATFVVKTMLAEQKIFDLFIALLLLFLCNSHPTRAFPQTAFNCNCHLLFFYSLLYLNLLFYSLIILIVHALNLPLSFYDQKQNNLVQEIL